MMLFDFKCKSCNHVIEEFSKSDDISHTIMCKCGGQMRRIISPVRSKLEGISGAFPTAYDKWDKKRQQHMKVEAKRNNG